MESSRKNQLLDIEHNRCADSIVKGILQPDLVLCVAKIIGRGGGESVALPADFQPPCGFCQDLYGVTVRAYIKPAQLDGLVTPHLSDRLIRDNLNFRVRIVRNFRIWKVF
jgi:hypothetical protein